MTRILHAVASIYPSRGGLEQTAEDVMRALSHSKDIEQKMICFSRDAEADGVVTHMRETIHDTLMGIEVVRCGSIANISSQLISLTFKRELKNLIEKFKPDIIIMHYPNPFIAHCLLPFLKRYKSIKFILYCHSDIVRQKILGKLFHGQNIRLCERADVIVATSENYIEGSQYLSMYKNKCMVINNCIQNSRIRETSEIAHRAEEIRREYAGKFISFSVGRNVPYKGFKYLIEASEYLDDDFVVMIAGPNTDSDEMKKLAAGNKKIKLLGLLNDEELNACYIASDIYSFPSITKNEAFGIALAEGMYFGKPAVTFTIPGSGVNYVSLNGITGLEVPNRDVRAFAEAMMKLKNDPELRRKLEENAMQRVIENFMYYKFRQKIINLISSLM